eukprot:scaffold55311_cov57-Phaeocystis_antarctica.AAC.2
MAAAYLAISVLLDSSAARSTERPAAAHVLRFGPPAAPLVPARCCPTWLGLGLGLGAKGCCPTCAPISLQLGATPAKVAERGGAPPSSSPPSIAAAYLAISVLLDSSAARSTDRPAAAHVLLFGPPAAPPPAPPPPPAHVLALCCSALLLLPATFAGAAVIPGAKVADRRGCCPAAGIAGGASPSPSPPSIAAAYLAISVLLDSSVARSTDRPAAAHVLLFATPVFARCCSGIIPPPAPAACMPGAKVAERAGAPPRFPAGEGCAEAERAFCAEPERCFAAAAACRASLSPGGGSMLRRCCSARSPSVSGAACIGALMHWCVVQLVHGCMGALVHWCVAQLVCGALGLRGTSASLYGLASSYP